MLNCEPRTLQQEKEDARKERPQESRQPGEEIAKTAYRIVLSV